MLDDIINKVSDVVDVGSDAITETMSVVIMSKCKNALKSKS